MFQGYGIWHRNERKCVVTEVVTIVLKFNKIKALYETYEDEHLFWNSIDSFTKM